MSVRDDIVFTDIQFCDTVRKKLHFSSNLLEDGSPKENIYQVKTWKHCASIHVITTMFKNFYKML